MPDRQLLAEARRLRAEMEALRSEMEQLRGRQRATVNAWEQLISTVFQVTV